MTKSHAYYNEIDPYAAQWLRELIKAGHIAPGEVDERSIEDVSPDDLREFTQCHFFAGIGVWSYALRQAGWSDDQPIWTGSCPCQPFSASGKRGGFNDERHLWPAFHWLIQQRGPATVLGEQVASKATEPWFDLVQADVEALGYAFGCIPFPSAGVGAPHVRDRAFWVAHSRYQGPQGGLYGRPDTGRQDQHGHAGRSGAAGGLDESSRFRPENGGPLHGENNGQGVDDGREFSGLADSTGERWDGRQDTSRQAGRTGAKANGETGGVADPGGERWERGEGSAQGREHDRKNAGRVKGDDGPVRSHKVSDGSPEPGPTNGFWREADWLYCRDEKWRPVEPGTFPLANGAPSRVGRLRAYGNAINAEAARQFIETAWEAGMLNTAGGDA